MKKHILLTLATAGLLLVACGEQPAASSVAPAGSSEPATSQSSGAAEASSSVQAEVAVTVALDADSKDTISIGGQTLVVATVTGTDTKTVSWSTSNAEIATVAAGVVTGKGAGDVTITATSTVDATKSASITIHVIDKAAGAKTVAELTTALKDLKEDEETTEEYVLKGRIAYVSEKYSATKKNISFYMLDEGKTNPLVQVYCGKADADSAAIDISELKANDLVYVRGKVKNYKGQLEFSFPEIVKIEVGEVRSTITKIKEAAAYHPIDVKGTVIATSTKGFVVNDGEASIYAYMNAAPKYADKDKTAIAVGDYVHVTGMVVEALSDHGYLQIGTTGLAVEKTEGTPAVPNATVLTKALADGLKTAAPLTSYTSYTWITTVGKSGSYLTYNVDDSDVLIEASYPATALKGEEGKHYTVTATFVGYDAKYDYATMVITALEPYNAVPESVAISGPTTVKAGERIELQATVSPWRASQAVNWTVDKEDIAQVTKEGIVVGKAVGTAKVTAYIGKLDDANVIKADYEVSVTEASAALVTGVTLAETQKQIAIEESYSVEATVAGEEGVNPFVTWSSSAPSVAKVDPITGKITGVTPGNATITATTVALDAEDAPKTATIAITVTNPYGEEDHPINVASAAKYIGLLEDNATTPVKMYVKGVVDSISYNYSGAWGKDKTTTLVFKDPTGDARVTCNYLYVKEGVAIPAINDEITVSGFGLKFVNDKNQVTLEVASAKDCAEADRALAIANTRGTSTITVEGPGCSVTGLPATAVNGTEQKFTVAVTDETLDLASVSVNGKVVEPKDGEYSFTVAGPMTVTASTMPKGAKSMSLAYSGSTTNMDGTNQAAKVGGDASIISVVGKKNSGTNNVGLNKDGTIRLYKGNATDVVIKGLTADIVSLKIACKTGSDKAPVVVKVGGNVITGDATGTFLVNAAANTEIVLTNSDSTNQVHITSIEIIYRAVEA